MELEQAKKTCFECWFAELDLQNFPILSCLGGVLKVGLNRAENPSDPLN